MKIKTLLIALLIAALMQNPIALMEELPEAQAVVVEEAAPTADGEDQAEPAEKATEPVADDAAEPASDDDAEPDADAPVPNEDVEEVDVEIASEPVDAVVEETEDAVSLTCLCSKPKVMMTNSIWTYLIQKILRHMMLILSQLQPALPLTM